MFFKILQKYFNNCVCPSENIFYKSRIFAWVDLLKLFYSVVTEDLRPTKIFFQIQDIILPKSILKMSGFSFKKKSWKISKAPQLI